MKELLNEVEYITRAILAQYIHALKIGRVREKKIVENKGTATAIHIFLQFPLNDGFYLKAHIHTS